MEETVAAGHAMKKPPATCTGCGLPILDQYILRVAPNLEWHAGCLRCCDCHARLDETSSCYVKQDRIYCKKDYHRLFGAKCSNCQLPIGEKAYVMKAGQQTYHTDCFNCSVCQRRLTKGDMFYQTKSGSLLCKTDHDAALQHQEKPLTAGTSSKEELISTHDNLAALQGGSGSGSGSSTSSTPDSTVPSGHGTGSASQTSNPSEAVSSGKQHTKSKKKKNGDKPARVRTVLTEKQLHTLRTCYAANPRPDALMKEQLCELTGLTPRVIRVWFQNKRCKDKKKAMLTQRQIEEGTGLVGLRGVFYTVYNNWSFQGAMIPMGLDPSLMRLPGTEGSGLPPLPSIPTIPGRVTPATPSTPGPVNVLSLLPSCSAQAPFHSMHHYREPHTPTTPVAGQSFVHFGSPPPLHLQPHHHHHPPLTYPPPPPLPPPPTLQPSPPIAPPMYPQTPNYQPVGYPPHWQHQSPHLMLDERPPLYPPDTGTYWDRGNMATVASMVAHEFS